MNKDNGESSGRILLAALALFVATAMLAQTAFAETQCLTDVSTSTSSSRATTGTTVTITATTTGSSCTVSTLSLVSTPSLTVNDPSSGQYSGFTAGTAKSFSVTAGTSGTYTYYARGTTTAGSVDSTSQILEFVSPSDLTVTASPSSASVTSGNSFNLTISVQNPQSSDVSTSYALNLPSGLTRSSGDPASSAGTTVSASSTKALVFEVAHSTCFTGSKTITFDLGGSSAAASVSVTGNSSCTSSTSSSSSSGGGGGGGSSTSGNPSYSITVTQMSPGSTADVGIKNSDIGINRIFVNVKSTVQNVKVNVTKLSSRPSYISSDPGSKVYQYNDVTLTNLASSNINSANVRFNVTKSWLSGNGYEYSQVSLYRYTDSWARLPTAMTSESSSAYEFEASTPGFSAFAIAAYKETAAPAAGTPNQTVPETGGQAPPSAGNQTTAGNETTTGTGQAETGETPQFPQDITYVILAILVAAMLFVAYNMILRKKSKKYDYKK